MRQEGSLPFCIFISYARSDAAYVEGLKQHLAPLGRRKEIILNDRGTVEGGEDSREKVGQYIDRSRIILLLLSSRFYASDHCQQFELPRILNQARSGRAVVFPILVSPVAWEDTGFNHLTVLPWNKRPVTTWHSQDEAWCDIAYRLEEKIKDIEEYGIPFRRQSRLADVFRPFSEISQDIRSSIEKSDSLWMLTRTGTGWFMDFPELFELFKASRPSRILLLNPESQAFEITKHEWRPWHFERKQSFDEYRDRAIAHIKSMKDHFKMRVIDVISPLVLLIFDVGEDSGLVYAEYPTLYASSGAVSDSRYQRKPIVRIAREDGWFYDDFVEAFAKLWDDAEKPHV